LMGGTSLSLFLGEGGGKEKGETRRFVAGAQGGERGGGGKVVYLSVERESEVVVVSGGRGKKRAKD